MRTLFFLVFSLIILSAHAWTYEPGSHWVCDKVPDDDGSLVDQNCRQIPGSAPELSFKLEPSDPKEVMSITKDITGRMTVERRDGSHETFRPDGMGGWQKE